MAWSNALRCPSRSDDGSCGKLRNRERFRRTVVYIQDRKTTKVAGKMDRIVMSVAMVPSSCGGLRLMELRTFEVKDEGSGLFPPEDGVS